MSDTPTPIVRPSLHRTTPNRSAANFYRSAGPGAAVGGVPLHTLEHAVVAAVRMGYKVAAEQIERTERLGRRLRQAADTAGGPGSDQKALDATEQIVFRAMMAGLSWFEGLASDGGNPLRRLATAEYRILGSMLGLTPPSDKPCADAGPTPPDGGPSAPPGPRADAGTPRPRVLQRQPRIKLEGARRVVQVRHYELTVPARGQDYPLVFYSAKPTGAEIKGRLFVNDQGAPTLSLKVPANAPRGVWKAAICDGHRMQIGHVKIVL